MARAPKTAQPAAPVASPAGTPDDPFKYSDGTPIVYLDGETQDQYVARVQKMVDDATAAAAQPPVTESGASVANGESSASDASTVGASVGTDDGTGVQSGDAGTPSQPATPAVPPVTQPPVADAPEPAIDLSKSDTAPPTAMFDDEGNLTTAVPSDYATMDEYLDAQNDIGNRVKAAHAAPEPAPLTDEEQALADAAAAEEKALDELSIDGRLRRLEASLGLRSPRLKA